MYPYLRVLKVAVGARFRPPLQIGDEATLPMRVWPGDIDFYPELNNGRYLTLMDLGRLDLAIRAGLFRAVRAHGWGLVVAGASVRFRHRLHTLRPFVLHTQLVGSDRLWFYFHHWTEHRGKTYCAALVRGGIASKEGVVPVQRVLEAAGDSSWTPRLPDWVRAWIDADDARPWPGPGLSVP